MGKVYVRVDDRLIHGQTIVAWCPTLGIQEIIAVDDASAQNPMLKSILTMGVPKNYVTNIVTTAEAKELLTEKSDKNRLVIVKVPEKLGELGESIADCEQLILGNMAKRPDTIHKVSGATGIFYLSDADVKLLDELAAKGTDVVFHQLPNASKVTWKAFKETL
ncbi:MAG: PTS sugar transporter subunit IIB [Lachnospiraceae bacterium]|jgi:mannose/fructose/N-acetylgalactosamine-specific phosphotransferase system component IIB|nr:PTS sugar transporter subunit IIB [Lachnospiraceae bacterium]